MKIVITGAGGFIGSHLARTLLARGRAPDGRAIEQVLLADRAPCAADDPRVRSAPGDIADAGFVARLIEPGTDLVFHLAGVMSAAAEADFALGLRVNLDGTRNVLEACRALARPEQPVRLVFASSIGVFGVPLPPAIDDATPACPTLSYGAQKRACEVLLDDYSRRGFADVRALRLPGVVVRPRASDGRASGAFSSFNSDVIGEPIAGRTVISPVGADAVLWLLSIERCVENLIRAAMLPAEALGARRALNLPCVVASVGEIAAALGRARGKDAQALIAYAPDAAVERQFGRWPRAFHPARALALGLRADDGIDDIVRRHAESTDTVSPGGDVR